MAEKMLTNWFTFLLYKFLKVGWNEDQFPALLPLGVSLYLLSLPHLTTTVPFLMEPAASSPQEIQAFIVRELHGRELPVWS